MRKNLLITVGPPGAGKSTWAEAHLPATCLRLERDRFRECLWGSRRAYHESAMPQREKSFVIGSAMFAAMNAWPYPLVALTDTGLFYDSVKRFIQHAGSVRLIVLDTPDAVLWERNRTRPEEHRVPDDILAKMIAEFHRPDAWWRSNIYNKDVIVP